MKLRKVNHARPSKKATPIPGADGEEEDRLPAATDAESDIAKLGFLAPILSSTKDLFYVWDRKKRFVYANRKLEELWGLAREGYRGKTHAELGYPPAVCAAVGGQIERVFATGETATGEVGYVSPAGAPVWWEYTFSPVRGEDGGIAYVAGVSRDISDRKRAEAALMESEAKYRGLYNAIDQGFFIIDVIFDAAGRPADLYFVETNDAANRILGRDYTGLRLREISPHYEEYWYEIFGRVARTGVSVRLERYAEPDKRWYDFFVFRVGGPDGCRIGNIFMDVTARKEMERELAEHRENLERLVAERTAELGRSERHYRTLVNNAPLVLAIFDREYRHVYMPAGAIAKYGLTPDQLVGKTWEELGVPADLRQRWKEKFDEVMATGRKVEYETRVTDEDGRVQDLLVNVVPQVDEAGRVEALLSFGLDITERNRALAQLRGSEERFRMMFDNSPAMMAILRMADNAFVEVNKSFLDILGFSREEVVGRSPLGLKLWPENRNMFEPLIAELREKGELRNVEFQLRKKCGEPITVLFTSRLIEFNGEDCRIGAMLDVTREKIMEAELLRLDRLNTVGEMAAAIGHEVRNPLTTVRGFLQLFMRRADSVYQEHCKVMIEELDRANAIISEFLSLAKNKAVEMEHLSLNAVIIRLLPLLQTGAYGLGHDVHFIIGDIPEIFVDEKEIRQLLLNLTRNGLEAMTKRGVLTIRTYMDGDQVALAVGDSGAGIPQDVMDKLGTPFTTTKENGTGLGLAVCYRIAERHGARIEVQTSPQGTTFVVRFAAGGRADR